MRPSRLALPGAVSLALTAPMALPTAVAAQLRITTPAAGAAVSGLVLLRWEVAGGDPPPAAIARVAIETSTDGGASFTPRPCDTPNDGSELVPVPPGAASVVFRVRAVESGPSAVSPVLEALPTPASVVVVRHAEKGPDEELTDAGRARAETLATLLRSASLPAVYASPASRAQDTARPSADGAQLALQTYDSEDALLALIRAARGSQRILVVGHSDTIPELVRDLGLPWQDPDPLPGFDRMFLVTFPGGEARLQRFHYTVGGEDGFFAPP